MAHGVVCHFDLPHMAQKVADWTRREGRPKADQMAHGVVCHFDLPHMAQKVADWSRREGRPRADEMAHGAVCRFELPHVAENNRRVTRVDSSLWPQRTVPKLNLVVQTAARPKKWTFLIKSPFENCLVDRLSENRFSKEVSWFPFLQNPNHGGTIQKPFPPLNPHRDSHFYKIPIMGALFPKPFPSP